MVVQAKKPRLEEAPPRHMTTSPIPSREQTSSGPCNDTIPPLLYTPSLPISHSNVPHSQMQSNMQSRGPILHYPSYSSNLGCTRIHSHEETNSHHFNGSSTQNEAYYHHRIPPSSHLSPTRLARPPAQAQPSSIVLPHALAPNIKSIELLQRLFPEQNRHVLELILQACDQDIVQTIECILPTHDRLTRRALSGGYTPCSCDDANCVYNRATPEPRSGSAFSPIQSRHSLPGNPPSNNAFASTKNEEMYREAVRSAARIPPLNTIQDIDSIPPVYIVKTSPSESPDSRVSSEEPAETTGDRQLEMKARTCVHCGRKALSVDNFCSTCGKKL